MKKAFLLFALLLTVVSVNAQEAKTRVFQQIYKQAIDIANDPKKDINDRKTAMFKADAVTYLSNKALSQITDTTKRLSNSEIAAINNQLDSMAYFMFDYINLFNREYSRALKPKQKKRILKIFREASINNPLYNDPEREYVLLYFNNDSFLTQFSLDTNWVKALADAKRHLSGRD